MVAAPRAIVHPVIASIPSVNMCSKIDRIEEMAAPNSQGSNADDDWPDPKSVPFLSDSPTPLSRQTSQIEHLTSLHSVTVPKAE